MKGRTRDASHVTSIRVDRKTWMKLKAAAKRDRRSLTGFLVVAGLERAKQSGEIDTRK